MSKVTLNSVADLTQSSTAQTTINTNSSTVQTAFDNTLSRDGTSPNQMGASLDMNSNQIINLPSPSSASSPARLQDVTVNPTIVVPPTGTSGAVVPFLNGNNTWSGTDTFNSTVTLANGAILGTPASGTLTNCTLPTTQITGLGTGVATFLATPSSANLASAVTGETGSGGLVFATGPTLSSPVISTISNTGTITLPTATDTLVGRATTDTLTNKTIGSTNSVTVSALNSGTSASSSTFWRGDGTWSLPPAATMVLLNTLTASNSATLSDTTSLTSTYSSYEIVFINIIPATNAVNFELQVHSGGTFPATSYLNAGLRWDTTTGTVTVTGGTTFINIGGGNANLANTGTGLSGKIVITNPSQTSTPKMVNGTVTSINTAAGNFGGMIIAGYWNGGNGAVDGFQVLMSSGNITSGIVKVYGIL